MFSVRFESVVLVLQAGSGDCRLFAQCCAHYFVVHREEMEGSRPVHCQSLYSDRNVDPVT